jgi:cytochrome c oxidase subunit 2
LLFNSYLFYTLFDYNFFEFFCSLIPFFFLFCQCFVSLGLLYYFNFFFYYSDLDLKVIGHQWYWRYDYSNFNGIFFDSYIKSSDDLFFGENRLIEVDNRCLIPINTNICFNLTSFDVIHSWTLFNSFLKIDCLSGILNIFYYNFPFVGVFYGQCSEICGANHRFIPVVLESVLLRYFKYWCLFLSFLF